MGTFRIIGKPFLEFLKNSLNPIINCVRNDNSLELLYRHTNNNEIVNIYYEGYSILKITQYSIDKYKGEMKCGALNYNKKFYKEYKDFPKSVKYLREKYKQEYNKEFCIRYDNINDWLIDLSSIKDACDEYKKQNPLKEKKYQQQLMLLRSKYNCNFLDIEYNPPKESKNAKNGDGRFDYIGITNDGIITYAELKVNSGACQGKSGIEDHLNKMLKYLDIFDDDLNDIKNQVEFWIEANELLKLKNIDYVGPINSQYTKYLLIVVYENDQEKRKVEKILKNIDYKYYQSQFLTKNVILDNVVLISSTDLA